MKIVLTPQQADELAKLVNIIGSLYEQSYGNVKLYTGEPCPFCLIPVYGPDSCSNNCLVKMARDLKPAFAERTATK